MHAKVVSKRCTVQTDCIVHFTFDYNCQGQPGLQYTVVCSQEKLKPLILIPTTLHGTYMPYTLQYVKEKT